ncbi:hypothetical protein GOV14_06075 [Candidatus Pacearchaeota archaeon]|nr:hypothetical protein [Candidatus Pacearchaeota archaeon]
MLYNNLRANLYGVMELVEQGDTVMIDVNDVGVSPMGVVTEKTPDYIQTAVNANPNTRRVAWKDSPEECDFSTTSCGRIKDITILTRSPENILRKKAQ